MVEFMCISRMYVMHHALITQLGDSGQPRSKHCLVKAFPKLAMSWDSSAHHTHTCHKEKTTRLFQPARLIRRLSSAN